MADLQLRFLKDMLVLSEPVWTQLARLGLNVARDGELTLLLEPEVFDEAYKLDALAGAQCLVAPTASLTPARLAHTGMRDRAPELAVAALEVVRAQNPQHVLVELGPCGLPLDPASRASLNENLDQYKRAADLFRDETFDAFFLNGFMRTADLKCALMGVRKVSDMPVLASVDVDASGMLPSGEMLADAAEVMAEYGAQVLGFDTPAPLEEAVALVQGLRGAFAFPLLAQLQVCTDRPELNLEEIDLADVVAIAAEAALAPEGPYANPDDMVDAADALREAGAQFLRATGDATPAYTGALVAATDDLDVIAPAFASQAPLPVADEDLDVMADRLRAKVTKAIGAE